MNLCAHSNFFCKKGRKIQNVSATTKFCYMYLRYYKISGKEFDILASLYFRHIHYSLLKKPKY